MLNQNSSLSSLLNGVNSSLLSPNNNAARLRIKNDNDLNSHSLNSNKLNTSQQPTRQNSFEIFNSVLQEAYSRMAFNPNQNTRFESTTGQGIDPNALANYSTPLQSTDKISSEQAAGTILSFIEARLKSDAANGATNEQLLERLDQGLEGFIKGFNEAKDIIQDLGLLTPELSQEIGDTYQRVTDRIEVLRNEINNQGNVSEGDHNRSNEVSSNQTRRLSLQTNSFQSESFSLSLTTQDGDRVTIQISQSNQNSFSASYSGNEDSFSFSSSQQASSNYSFNLSVQGELDEGELNAIDGLLQDINNVAVDFYAGNLDDAFASASSLELDREELSSLNLQLRQTTTTSAIASYESISPEIPATPSIDLEKLLDRLDEILADARTFNEPLKLVNDILDKTVKVDEQTVEHAKKPPLDELIGNLISQFKL